jgi:hypothetical protein
MELWRVNILFNFVTVTLNMTGKVIFAGTCACVQADAASLLATLNVCAGFFSGALYL